MRIGLVIYGSPDTLSGGYLYDRKLVEYLRASGDEVEILSMPRSSYPNHLFHNFSVFWMNRLAQSRFDLLLQDELNHPSLFLLNRMLKSRVSYRIISIVHNLRCCGHCSMLERAVIRTVEKQYLKSVDGFVFNSLATKASVQQCLGHPVNGLIAYPAGDRLGIPPTEQEIRIKHSQKGSLRLAFVGNLSPIKGLDGLLQSLSVLRDKPWELFIAGGLAVEPGYTKRMRKLAAALQLQDKVKFLGPLSDGPLARLYRDSHIIAMPFSHEGFGIVYLEGMCYGLPALASSFGGASEIISHGETGYLLAPGDVNRVTQIIDHLITDRDELLRLSLAARRNFERFPTWKQTCAKIRNFLLDLAC